MELKHACATSLWDFALAFYARPHVQESCLQLQDSHGVDVNLLLFTAWAGHCCGIRVDRQLLAQADERIRPWRTSVVHPLRQARRDMKQDSLAQFHAGAAALRQRVKDLELQAERLQLEHLEGFLLAGRARGRPGAPLARLNLAELLAWAGAPDEPHLQHLLTALRAV
jgi:uncharacterized protein (TIGR02444 family)